MKAWIRWLVKKESMEARIRILRTSYIITVIRIWARVQILVIEAILCCWRRLRIREIIYYYSIKRTEAVSFVPNTTFKKQKLNQLLKLETWTPSKKWKTVSSLSRNKFFETKKIEQNHRVQNIKHNWRWSIQTLTPLSREIPSTLWEHLMVEDETPTNKIVSIEEMKVW
jgi:hypothetical protein